MNVYYLTFFVLHYCLCTTIHKNGHHNLIKKNGGFLFYMPKILVSGKNETVCLSLHEAIVPAKTIVDFRWKEKHFVTIRNLDAEHSCFDLYVPHLEIKEPYYVSITIQVQLNDTVESSHNQDPVLLYPDKLVKTFINTDREFYKPGDKIKFRIFTIDEQFLPLNSKIKEIKIKNPLDTTVSIWENVIPENGLVSLEYQMVAESITGKWKIEASGEKKEFEVSKYVLPRFEIKMVYPKLIYYKANALNIKVCGQYSYGKQVKGLALVKITNSHNNITPVHKMQELQDGCAVFVIPSEGLEFSKIKEKFPMYDPKMHIHITASVTEKGTNIMNVVTEKSMVSLKAYTMQIIGSPIFQPGLPYNGKIKLSNVHVNLTNEVIEVCYNLAIKKSWNYINKEQCSNFTLDENEAVEFNVLPMKGNVIHIHFNARSLNHTDIGDSLIVVRLFSPSNSYIILQQHILEKPNDECRAPQQFAVHYTTDRLHENENITFYYMIKSRNRIYKLRRTNHLVKKNSPDYTNLTNILGEKHKFTKLNTSIDNFMLKFRLDRRIGSKYQLLVYYVTSYGETVAVSKNIDVEACLLQVDAKWLHKQMVPGATATLNIKTEAHAMCSVSAVDKSTKFFPNSRQKFDVNALLESFSEGRDYPVSGRKTCIVPTKRTIHSHAASLLLNTENTAPNDLWDLRRRKRHVYSFSEDFDSYNVFSNFGTVVITNLRVITKPCYTGPLLKDNNPVQFLTGQYENQNEEKAITMRSFFPETWLWELVPVSDHVQLKRHLPHTITNWVTNVLCISDEEGIGFSQESELKSFQSFFVEIIIPYSVKRGETFSLYFHISNYLSHMFPIRITLRLSEGLDLEDPKDQSTSYCLTENNTFTHMVRIKGSKIGTVNVTVLAESDNQYPDQCGPEIIVSQRDIFLKTFQVEPEGYPKRVAKSALLCSSGTETSHNVSWHISTHKETVVGTNKAYISLNAEILGQTIENLEELLDIPTGCGEQIMSSIAPNLYVLRYLNATNSLKPSTRHRIVRNLKVGYQRILNYVHKDGSFSAFGYHDSSGSMFLTAFVVRTLQEAKKYIYIDQRVIDKAVAWIFDHQLENGCFNTMLHVFQDMGGTSKENSTASLTAYVITSLMEGNIDVPKTIQTNAKYCIRSQRNPDIYTLAISCYALFKVDWYSEANRMLNRLLELSNQQQNLLWWNGKDNTSIATDTEITSYVLLSLLHQNNTENMAHAHSVVRWLTSKYGPKGGFKSTQDTVVALDALTKYSTLIRTSNLDIRIKIESNEYYKNVTFKSVDKMKSKRITLNSTDDNIRINVEGEGCVLAQVIQSYYLTEIPKSEVFKLAVDVAPVSTIDQCSITSVSPCLAYVGPDGPSNMAVMEVTLPSGYEADRASLYKLVEMKNTSRVKMFEELKNKVNLYFTKLDKQLVCFTFNINEHSVVEARKDSVVKLYDYYRPEYEILQFYRINENCGYNNSVLLPEVAAKPLSTKIKINNVTIELPENQNETLQKLNQDLEENIVKRSTDYLNTGNDNTQYYYGKNNGNIKRQAENQRIKRKLDFADENKENVKGSNFNKDFVDIDTDMDFSNCSGNVPYYTTKDISNRSPQL